MEIKLEPLTSDGQFTSEVLPLSQQRSPLVSIIKDEDGDTNSESLMVDRYEILQPENEVPEIDISFEAVKCKIEIKTEMEDDSIPGIPRDLKETGRNFETRSLNNLGVKEEEEIPGRDGTNKSQLEKHFNLGFPQKIDFQDFDMHMEKTIDGESEYSLSPAIDPDIFVPTEDETDRKKRKPFHTGEKPYACPVCQMKFIRKDNLNDHSRTHTGDEPYVCAVCEVKFRREDQLNNHLRTHTGEKPFNCAECNRKFRNGSNLKRHFRKHTGDKPHACSDCQMKFRRKDHLNNHSRTHTGEKPFNCPECNMKFPDKSNLRRHFRKHTGEKPYACLVCQMKFRRKDNLNDHSRTHTREKPFTCAKCDKKFSSKRNFTAHLRTHAREETKRNN